MILCAIPDELGVKNDIQLVVEVHLLKNYSECCCSFSLIIREHWNSAKIWCYLGAFGTNDKIHFHPLGGVTYRISTLKFEF